MSEFWWWVNGGVATKWCSGVAEVEEIREYIGETERVDLLNRENETRERETAEVKKQRKVGQTEALVGSLSSGPEQLLLLSF